MQTDSITEIVKKYRESPYNCILINGIWGIGKTYAINQAFSENDYVCNISLFGLSDAQQIYHEILFSFVLNSRKVGKNK